MATLFKRSNGIWYVVYKDGHRRRWLSTGFRSKLEACEAFETIKSQVERPTVLTVGEFAQEFLPYAQANLSPGTCYIYSIAFRHFLSITGNKRLELVTPIDVEKFKAKRLESVSRVRVNIEFRTLKAAFNKAVAWGYLASNPFNSCSQLRVPPSEPVYLKKVEFKKLLEGIADQEFRELVIFAVSTMMRLGEILMLTWSDVDFNHRLIHVRNKATFTVKGGRPRVVPISEQVFYMLLNMERRSQFVFSNKDRKPLLTRSASRRFKRYVLKCGLPSSIHFHSLRHTGASWLVQESVPLFEIQQILGHSSPSVTQIYSHLSHEKLRETVEKIKWN